MYELGGSVRVIKTGTCTIDPGLAVSPLYIGLKRQLGIGGGSTVTLLRDGADLLLVDTGYDHEADLSPANDEANWQALRMCLEQAGVDPAAIRKVFLTHLHRDHGGNLARLPQAQWYCTRAALAACNGEQRERFIPLDEGDCPFRNVALALTPGHTPGHGSLVWSAGGVRIAIAGDAIINLAWLQSGHIWRFNGDFDSAEMARESAARLLRAADLIIPGHGQPFFVQPGMLAGLKGR